MASVESWRIRLSDLPSHLDWIWLEVWISGSQNWSFQVLGTLFIPYFKLFLTTWVPIETSPIINNRVKFCYKAQTGTSTAVITGTTNWLLQIMLCKSCPFELNFNAKKYRLLCTILSLKKSTFFKNNISIWILFFWFLFSSVTPPLSYEAGGVQWIRKSEREGRLKFNAVKHLDLSTYHVRTSTAGFKTQSQKTKSAKIKK